MVSGLLPLLFSQALINRKAKIFDKFVGLTLCIGGGVLLATVFIHMIPETRESLDNAAGAGYLPDSHYAFAELFVCLGFMFIYFIEAFVHRFFQGGSGGHSRGIPIAESQTFPRTKGEIHELKDSSGGTGMDNAGFVSELDVVGTVKGNPSLRNHSAG